MGNPRKVPGRLEACGSAGKVLRSSRQAPRGVPSGGQQSIMGMALSSALS